MWLNDTGSPCGVVWCIKAWRVVRGVLEGKSVHLMHSGSSRLRWWNFVVLQKKNVGYLKQERKDAYNHGTSLGQHLRWRPSNCSLLNRALCGRGYSLQCTTCPFVKAAHFLFLVDGRQQWQHRTKFWKMGNVRCECSTPCTNPGSPQMLCCLIA